MTAQPGEPDDALLRTAVPEGTFVLTDGVGVGEARRFAAGFLAGVHQEHGIAVGQSTEEITVLVVSELVTNARKYAPGPVVLHLRLADGSVQVSVWDTAPGLPRPQSANPRRVGQHGLEIVKALVQRFEVHEETAGKRITGHIAVA